MKRLFGTDGIRGTVNSFPLDQKTLNCIGIALADHLDSLLSPCVLIGRDTRDSGQWILDCLAQSFVQKGIKTIHDVGVITTPGLSYLTCLHRYDMGIMISASHNPYHDNGIKIFSNDGFKLDDEKESQIEQKVFSYIDTFSVSNNPQNGQTHKKENLVEDYVNFLRDQTVRDLSSVKLGLDVCNGSAYSIAPKVFSDLGAVVTVINKHPDGFNINRNCGSLHLEGLRKLVIENQLDFGIAFDGDADRCLMVTGSGRIFDGDYILYALACDLKEHGKLLGGKVVGTIMTNFAAEKALTKQGIELVRSAVGDRNVLIDMLKSGSVLGGEPSGHIILRALHNTGDGILTGIKLTELLCRNGLALDDVLQAYKPYPQVLDGLKVTRKISIQESPQLSRLIETARDDLRDSGRMVVRYSGTEPLLRIMAEGQEIQKVKNTVEKLKNKIGLFFEAMESS